MIRAVPDYGDCPCGGRYERRAVEVRLGSEEPKEVLTDVPQGACPVCGSRVYKTEVLERIEALFVTVRRDSEEGGASA